MKPIKNLKSLLREEYQDRNCPTHGRYVATLIYLGNELKQVTECPECEAVRKKHEAELLRNQFEANRFQDYLRTSRIPSEYQDYRLQGFKPVDQSQDAAFNLSMRFVKGWKKALAGGYGLIFLGTCGTGKTHLATSIAIALYDVAKSVAYYKASEIFSAVRQTYSANSQLSEEEVIRRFSKIELLVIDELGVQKGSDAERRTLFAVLDNRMSDRKPTILISNLNKKELQALLGERLYDRIRSKCVPAAFIGKSQRKAATEEVFDE